jgi:SAM-dependent methyltransferase
MTEWGRVESVGWLIDEYGLTDIVEVGVFYGDLAAGLLNAPHAIAHYWLVDGWEPYRDEHGTIGYGKSPLEWDFIAEHVKARMACEPRVEIIRKPSTAAAKLFADASVDLVFIDAAHDHAHVKADIEAWWPKVRPGGVISGHDYMKVPGVALAVNEAFVPGEIMFLPDYEFTLDHAMLPDDRWKRGIWYVVKGA